MYLEGKICPFLSVVNEKKCVNATSLASLKNSFRQDALQMQPWKRAAFPTQASFSSAYRNQKR
jgi:hypothetical protein